MITKDQFLSQAEAAISEYPTIAQLYQARDPRVTAQISAMAAMLSLLSESLDVQASEPFTKARDVTVLADASVKGILPFGEPKQVQIAVTNGTANAFAVTAGRRLQDARGRIYTVVTGSNVPPGGTGKSYSRTLTTVTVTFTGHGFTAGNKVQVSASTDSGLDGVATIVSAAANSFTFTTSSTGTASGTMTVRAVVTAYQESERSISHTVTAAQPFYGIFVPNPEVGVLSRIRLIDAFSNEYEYRADFLNVGIGEQVFHLETDESRNMYVRFGATDVAGYQPAINEVFTVLAYDTEGNFDLDSGSKFVFEVSVNPNEVGAVLVLAAVVDPGANAMDISTIREISNYPSIYDESSVFLNNFDFLIRRNLGPFDFLSVWNEYEEEGVRGASLDNINTLFVAAQKTGVAQPTLESQISQVIEKADDSYKVSFVAIIPETIKVKVTLRISPVYDQASVEQQIRDLLLEQYDQNSVFATRGQLKIKYRDVYDLLTDNVQALQGDQAGDMQLSITYTGNDDAEFKTGKAYSRTLTTVTVTFNNHGFSTGNIVSISNATDSGLNGDVQVTGTTTNTFTFETVATGTATGTLSVKAEPKPEKWRYVNNASITVLF